MSILLIHVHDLHPSTYIFLAYTTFPYILPFTPYASMPAVPSLKALVHALFAIHSMLGSELSS
jgi:hypothetical protein